jgi:hypothetical protein
VQYFAVTCGDFIGHLTNAADTTTMKLTFELSTSEAVALRRFAKLHHPLPIEETAALALREFLIGTGDLELAPALEEDSVTDGSA